MAELLIVIAIIVTSLVYLLGIINFSLRIIGEKKRVYQANFLAKEAMEGVRNFRDGTSWDVDGLGVLTVGVSYHIESTSTPEEWDLVLGEAAKDGFTEKIVFYEVQRDGNDDIVESGGAVDSDTKKVIVTISWTQRNKPQQIEVTTYLTNWQQTL